jgi:hypothetical protein
MKDPTLRRYGLILAVADGVLALAFISWQSIASHRVSPLQIALSDFFWMGLLCTCLLRFRVPKWIVGLECFYIFAFIAVVGVMRVFSYIQTGKPLEALFSAFYILAAIVNLAFYTTWFRTSVVEKKRDPAPTVCINLFAGLVVAYAL